MNNELSDKQHEEIHFVQWPCPICKHDTVSGTIATKDYNHGISGKYTYNKCSVCGLWRQDPRPDNETLGNAYPLHYGSSPDVKMNPHSRINCYANKKRYNFTRVIKAKKLSVFDIGCGSGFFLAFLRNNGWQVAGLDSAPEHIAYAQKTLGLTDVITAQWPGYNPACKDYDLVSLIHVLEHLPDPVEGLRAAAAMLKPGGYLLTETPNVNAWARYVYGGRCNMFDAPRHLCLFSQATFRKCAAEAGLKTVKMITYSPSLDGYIESLRYLLQDIKIRKYNDKSAHSIAATGNVATKMETKKATTFKQKIIAASHSSERFVDRCIDTIASSTGGGLTLLSLTQKDLK